MRSVFFCLVLLIASHPVFSQQLIDSSFVSGKVKSYIQQIQEQMPALSMLKVDAQNIDNRTDFSPDTFDFTKANDPKYIQSRTKKVFVTRYRDIKYAGFDIYVQTSSTKFPLTNMEIHADASGKLSKAIPFEEIQHALTLLEKVNLLSFEEVRSRFLKEFPAATSYSYASLLIDLPSSSIKWQVRGLPNWQTQKQDLFVLDAVSGTILQRQQQSMNIASATVSQ